MTINNATVEQINVALLDLDKRIKALNIDNEAIKSLQNSVKTIKSSLNETKAGLQSGATYNINISGNASTATHAATATTAEVVNVAESAAEADHAKTADTATKAAEADHAKLADNIAAGGTSGQVLTSNGPSTAPSWQDQKFTGNIDTSIIPNDASASNKLATQSMLPEFKNLTTGNADELRSFANNKLYSLKVHTPFNVMDDNGTSYKIPMYAEAIFYKHSGDITVQFHSYYGKLGIWEVFYNSNGQTRGKKIV